MIEKNVTESLSIMIYRWASSVRSNSLLPFRLFSCSFDDAFFYVIISWVFGNLFLATFVLRQVKYRDVFDQIALIEISMQTICGWPPIKSQTEKSKWKIKKFLWNWIACASCGKRCARNRMKSVVLCLSFERVFCCAIFILLSPFFCGFFFSRTAEDRGRRMYGKMAINKLWNVTLTLGNILGFLLFFDENDDFTFIIHFSFLSSYSFTVNLWPKPSKDVRKQKQIWKIRSWISRRSFGNALFSLADNCIRATIQ